MSPLSVSIKWAATQCAELLWPSRCAACDVFVAAGEAFCGPCQTSVTLLDDPCAGCAMPLLATARCQRCERSAWPFAAVSCAAHYGGAISTALVRFKHGRQDLTRNLVPLVLAALAPLVASLPVEDACLIVPVPLHRRRLRRRGFNQALLLAQGAAQLLKQNMKVAIKPLYLKRIRDGEHLPHESPAARQERSRNAFVVPHGSRVANQHIILVDDVLTTGATSCACAEALLLAGAWSVRLATVARAV